MLSYEKKQKMINGFKTFRNICTAIVILVIVSFVSIGVYKIKTKDKVEEKSEAAEVFAETVDVTVYDVKRHMSPIGELATYEQTYEGHEKMEDYVEAFGKWNVPFTKHTIDIQYDGVLKVGYEMKDIDVSVDTDEKVINVVLPEVQVLDNYVDTYSTVDDNNVFNPIESDEAQNYLDSVVEPKELKEAEEAGIYQKAEENAKELIKNELCYFEKFGYTVKFPETVKTK